MAASRVRHRAGRNSMVAVDHTAAPASRGAERRSCSGVSAYRRSLVFLVALASAPADAADGSALATQYPLACRYARVELERYEGCARRDGEAVRFARAHIARMRFLRGLAEAAIDEVGWLWVRRDGLARPVFVLDTGPDPFEQGLARGWHQGKVAFYDRQLRLVLATPYDWSFPFNARGEALVCEACHSDGREPSSMIGGRWGLIDRQGRLLTPLSAGEAASDRYFDRR